MFRRTILIPIIFAASVALAGCNKTSADAAANNAAAAPTNAAATNTAAQSPAYGGGGGGAPTGGTCGTIVGIQCGNAADFCKLPTGQCQVSDAAGTCTRRPEVCTRDYRPVCGCNGRTYGNACAADAAGVSIQAQGACSGAAASETNTAAAQ